jgi:hypothetical protein
VKADVFEAKVNAAIEKMRGDRRLKRTVVELAELVGCTTGTLYNHEWPINRLRDVKNEPTTPVPAPKKTVTVEPHAFNAELSDKEIMRWKTKCDKLSAENSSLKSRVEELREQVQALTDEAALGANVRSLTAKRGRTPGEDGAPA